MKTYIIVAVVSLGLGYSFGHYLSPTKVEIKEIEKVVTKEGKERVKTVYVKETKQPDGTVVREETSKEEEKTKTDIVSNSNKDSTTSYYQPEYAVSVFMTTPLTSPVIGVNVSKRFIGPITLGVVGLHHVNRVGFPVDLGVSIGVQF